MLSNTETATLDLSGGLQELLKKIEANWPVLPSGIWNSSSIQTLTRHLHELSKYSDQAGLEALNELALLMDEKIQDIIDENAPPDSEQIDTLNESLRQLNQAVEGVQLPLPGNAARSIDLLLLYRNEDAREQIENAATLQEWHYRALSNLAELRVALGDGAKTVLIHSAFLPELNQHPEILEPGKGDVPQLFFVSDHCDIETRLQAMRAGALQLFSEPIDLDALVKVLGEYIRPKAKPRPRILIVEDDESQARFAAALLQRGALETLCVTDPLGVIDAVWSFQPDLILMDLYMAGADGIELTRLIRDREESVGIPIVFLSGEEDLEKKLLALQAGADDFLTKPVRPQQLLATVKTRIERARAICAAGLGQKDGSADGVPSRRALLSRLDLACIDREAGRQIRGLIVISLGDPQSDPTSRRGGGPSRRIAAVAEWLKPRLQEEDYLASIGYSSLAIMLRRPSGQEVERLADLTYDIVKRMLNKPPQPGRRFGIGLAMLDDSVENAYALLRHGESAAASAYERALEGYLLYREAAPATGKKAQDELGRRQVLFIRSLRSGAVKLQERRFTCRPGMEKAIDTLELIPLSSASGAPDNLYQTAALCAVAAEFDHFVCHLGIQRLGEYALHGKSVRLILRQSAAMMEGEEYLEFIKSELRRLQIVGTGLMMEFDLPSLAFDLKRARARFGELAALGIGISLCNFACNETAFKILAYLRANAVRPHLSLLRAGEEKIQHISRQTHSLRAEIILPLVERHGQIALQWSESADYIQADF